MNRIDSARLSGLEGATFPNVRLPATNGKSVALAAAKGLTVLLAFPRISPANGSSIPGWDTIPGAKGCTAQTCGFRDEFQSLLAVGASQIFGISTQDTAYQREAVARLGLPYALLSDADLKLQKELNLPMFEAGELMLLHRFSMVINDGKIEKVFHSLEDTSSYARVVLEHLQAR